MRIVCGTRVISTTLTGERLHLFAQESLGLAPDTYLAMSDDEFAASELGIAMSIESARDRVLGAIQKWFKQSAQELVSPYPDEEQKTFTIQEQQARAYIADPLSDVTFIADIAAAEDVTVEEKALSIIAKADAFKSAFGMFIGTRHRLKDAALAAQSLTELADIEAQLL